MSACVCACMRALVVLLAQHATRIRHIVSSFVASGFTKIFDIISKTVRFSGEKIIEHRMRVLIFSTTFV